MKLNQLYLRKYKKQINNKKIRNKNKEIIKNNNKLYKILRRKRQIKNYRLNNFSIKHVNIFINIVVMKGNL
jgi:hypothetical protein